MWSNAQASPEKYTDFEALRPKWDGFLKLFLQICVEEDWENFLRTREGR